MKYIHQLVQARLNDNADALNDVYNCLHFFCQSLQLELLYTQSLRLRRDRLDDNINVEEYVPGVKVVVSYWRELTSNDAKSELGYRLIVQADHRGLNKSLVVLHVPSLSFKDSVNVSERVICSDYLSMERLIVHTIYVRSLSRLNDLKTEFQTLVNDADRKYIEIFA